MKKLSHRQAQELLIAGTLPDAETRTTLAEHLSECDACREYNQITQRLAEGGRKTYPKIIRTKNVKVRIARALEEELGRRRKIQRIFSPLPALAWAGAILALVLALSWAFKYTVPQPASTATVVSGGKSTQTQPTENAKQNIAATPTVKATESGWGIEPAGQSEFLGGIGKAISIGGDFAYVGILGRLSVIDLSDLKVVSSAGYSDKTEESTQDVLVNGGYAYIANWLDGFYILDVRDPLHPRVVGHSNYAWAGEAPKVSLPHVQQVVAVQGGLAYIMQLDCESPCGDPDMRASLRILNVSDPSKPVEVGSWDTGSFNAVAAVSESYALLALPGGQLQILDVSNPGAIREVGSIELGGVGEIEVSGTYAYVLAAGPKLVTLDISNPADPKEVAVFSLPDSDGRYRLAVSNGYAYLADGSFGTRRILILDVSNPAEPQQVAYYEDTTQRSENSPEYAPSDVAVSGDRIFLIGGTRNVDVYRFTPAQKAALSPYSNGESLLVEDDLNCDGNKERLLGVIGEEIPYFNITPQLQSIALEAGQNHKRVLEITAKELGAAYLAYDLLQADDCNRFLVLLAHKGKESLQVFHWDGEKVSRVLDLSGLFLFSGEWQQEMFGDIHIPPNTLTFVQYDLTSGVSTWTLRGYRWDGERMKPVLEERRTIHGGG